MEAEPVDGRTALAWARSVKIDSNKLAVINAGRQQYGLPPFKIVKAVFGQGDTPIPVEPASPEALKLARVAVTPAPAPPPPPPRPKVVTSFFDLAAVLEAEKPIEQAEITDIVLPPPPAPPPVEESPQMSALPALTPPPKIERSIKGLIEALFDELDAMRDGTGSKERVQAVVGMAGKINALMQTEITVRKMLANQDGVDKRLGEIAGR